MSKKINGFITISLRTHYERTRKDLLYNTTTKEVEILATCADKPRLELTATSTVPFPKNVFIQLSVVSATYVKAILYQNIWSVV